MPDRNKFGHDFNIEMMAIEDELRKEGLKGSALYFASKRKYEEKHKNDQTFKEKCAELNKQWAAKLKKLGSLYRLTDEEIEYLLFKLEGANNPLAQSIIEKISKETEKHNA